MSSTIVVRNSHRDALLDAAEAIVTAYGVSELTLDGVAAKAGVTKGGLIYHFKTKEILLAALVERMLEQIETRIQKAVGTKKQTPETLLTILVNDTFDMRPEEKALQANLLAAVSSYPKLLKPVQELYQRTIAQLTSDPAHIGLALMISCATDGLLFLELLNLKHFSAEERQQMRQALLDTIRRAAA